MMFIGKLDVLIFVIVLVNLYICPYTKVEESFNTQASYDLLYYGGEQEGVHNASHILRNNFDHFEFPGVVPRTFLAPIVLSTISRPLIHFYEKFVIPMIWGQGQEEEAALHNKFHSLFIVRILIGAFCVLCNSIFRDAIRSRYHSKFLHVSSWYALLICCQFHLVFYMSRPLPNTFALGLVLVAYAYWLREKYAHMFCVFGFAIALFRGELLALVAPIALIVCIFTAKYSFLKGLFIGLLSVIASIGFSIFVDSYFWQRIVWPEGEVLLFNTIQNKSSEWGTSPFYWYFTSALPRALLIAVPFTVLSVFQKKVFSHVWQPLLVALTFIGLYSILPHKELRFVFYAIPLFNLCAAVCVSYVVHGGERRDASEEISRSQGNHVESSCPSKFWNYILLTIILICFMISFCISQVFVYASSKNYFGADALNHLHATLREKNIPTNVTIHMDGMATMNGVSRFLQTTQYRYSKEERDPNYSNYDYILTGNPEPLINGSFEFEKTSDIDAIQFKQIAIQEGFKNIDIKERKIITEPKIFVLEKQVHNRSSDEYQNELTPWEEGQYLVPIIKWAQRRDKILLIVELYDVDKENLKIETTPTKFMLKTEINGKRYYLKLEMFDELNPSETQVDIGSRWVKVKLFKKNKKKPFWKRIIKQTKIPKNIKIDWDNWSNDNGEYNQESEESSLKQNDDHTSNKYSNGHGTTQRYINHLLRILNIEPGRENTLIEKYTSMLPLPREFSFFITILCTSIAILFHFSSMTPQGSRKPKSE